MIKAMVMAHRSLNREAAMLAPKDASHDAAAWAEVVMFREVRGCLFRSEAQCLVNTVNCVGPIGRGIALEFKNRYPAMYAAYRDVCKRELLRPA